jgi:hypothetical protein
MAPGESHTGATRVQSRPGGCLTPVPMFGFGFEEPRFESLCLVPPLTCWVSAFKSATATLCHVLASSLLAFVFPAYSVRRCFSAFPDAVAPAPKCVVCFY